MNKISIFLMLLLILGCSDATSPAPDVPFSLTYRVNFPFTEEFFLHNDTADTFINAIHLEAITYYPEIDQSIWQFHTFQKATFDTARLLISPGKDVYEGCTREFLLGIAYRHDTYMGFWKYYFFPKDTIKNIRDSVYLVIYPEDTTKASFQDHRKNKTSLK